MFKLAAVASPNDASSSSNNLLKRKTPSEKTKTCTRCLTESDTLGNSQPHGRFLCSPCCKELKDQFDHQLALEGWRWHKDADSVKDEERDETIKRLESINERLRVIITQKDAKIKSLYDVLKTIPESLYHFEATIRSKIEWIQAKKELNVEEDNDDLVEDEYSQSE